MKEIILSLMVWLGANTVYTQEVAHPTIVIATQQELQEKMGGAYQGNYLLGVYASKNFTLYLDDSVDVNTNEGKSTLLHELVHHYQAKTGKRVSNYCLYEAEAYSIEDKWRRHNDMPSAINPGLVFWIGQCVMSLEYVK